MLLTPLLDCLRIPAEHPFPGTGSVHQHPIKKAGKRGTQRIRVTGRNNRVAYSHALEIGKQHVCPAFNDLIAPQQPLSLEQSGNL